MDGDDVASVPATTCSELAGTAVLSVTGVEAGIAKLALAAFGGRLSDACGETGATTDAAGCVACVEDGDVTGP